MTCEDTEEQLVFFHLGESEDRAAIEAHLCECGQCLKSYWFLKQTFQVTSRLTAGPAPARILREKIRAVVLPLPKRVAVWRRPLAGVGALAVALLVVVIGMHPSEHSSTKTMPVAKQHVLEDVDSSRQEPATLNFL